MKYLIVNADDFGMTKSINEGIIKARREGIVTDVSMLATGRAFDDAVNLAGANGISGVGAHLSLTELAPVPPRRGIMSRGAFLLEFLSGRLSEGDIRLELRRQLDRIKGSGLEITHIDSHEHLHMLPRMLKIFIELAGEYGIPAIRFLRNDRMAGMPAPEKLFRCLIMGYFATKGGPIFKGSRLRCTDRVLGFLGSGRLSEKLVIGMLDSLPEGSSELICHPGFLSPEVVDDYSWHVNCEAELFILTSRCARNSITKNGINLVSHASFSRTE